MRLAAAVLVARSVVAVGHDVAGVHIEAELAAACAEEVGAQAHSVPAAFELAEPAVKRVEHKPAARVDNVPAVFEVERAGRCAQGLGLR